MSSLSQEKVLLLNSKKRTAAAEVDHDDSSELQIKPNFPTGLGRLLVTHLGYCVTVK
jgi:hypothetical protein